MLALLAVYHLTITGTNALPIQDANEPTSPQCVSLNNCRSMSTIVWGCLTTIFVCTWVTIHPNIPYPVNRENWSFWKKRQYDLRVLFSQGLPLFLLAVIFPEYVLGWAIRQRFVANQIVKEAKGEDSVYIQKEMT